MGATEPSSQTTARQDIAAQLGLGQRDRSGQHSPWGIGGIESSLQTTRGQFTVVQLRQRETSEQHPPSGIGAADPSGQGVSWRQ